MERRLTTIVSLDVVGYSRLMAADESDTLDRLKSNRSGIIDPKAAEYNGRIVKLMGDGTLMEFGSVVDAVNFAVDVQRAMATNTADVNSDNRFAYRIGINIGDIIVEGDDIYGDGVNVAARLEGLAEAGGICISRDVHSQVRAKVDVGFDDLGEQTVKNIPEPVQVYRVVLERRIAKLGSHTTGKAKRAKVWPMIAGGLAVILLVTGALFWQRPWEDREEPIVEANVAFPLPDKPSIAVLPFNNMSDDASQEYFADGMTEDLITDLSKISGLFVIARNTVFTYKDKSVLVPDLAKKLGVKFVLEGSVRRVGDVVRINTQLTRWLQRYSYLGGAL